MISRYDALGTEIGLGDWVGDYGMENDFTVIINKIYDERGMCESCVHSKERMDREGLMCYSPSFVCDVDYKSYCWQYEKKSKNAI